MIAKPTVYVVDDDEAVRDSVRWLLESAELRVRCYPDALSFLQSYEHEHPSCLVLDVRIPGMSGLELQRKLTDDGVDLPVLIITGHGDVPMAVEAMKAGALDFLEKPFSDKDLLDQVQRALRDDALSYENHEAANQLAVRFARLSPREHQVMELVVDGTPSKQIGQKLGITLKTVEAHRARIMEKTGASSIAQLVRMFIEWSAANHDCR